MRLIKLATAFGLACCAMAFTNAGAQAPVGLASAPSNIQLKEPTLVDIKSEKVRNNVNEADNLVQNTFDQLRADSKKFGDEWKYVEGDFLSYSESNADYISHLVDFQETICRKIGGDECLESTLHDLERASEDMKLRAEIISKVALDKPVEVVKWDKTYDQDPESSLFRAVMDNLSDKEGKELMTATRRTYTKMKLTYVGLLSDMMKYYKNPDLVPMTESELARLDEERAAIMNSIYSKTGKEPVAPRAVGPKRKAAILEEFIAYHD
ncbi:MAG: hypothetical protein LUC43_00910 [Burkholderiales bacterium]|nr:hypothetical protein [Burkholderiales bacterium]